MRMMRWIVSRWGVFVGALAVTALASGCALNVVLEITPQPAPLGQPLTYKITVTNPTACTLSGASLILVPLVERDAEIDQLCVAFQNPALTLCENIDPDMLPPEIVGMCCDDPTFAMDNPSLCITAMNGGPVDLAARAQSFLGTHPVTTHGVLSVTGSGGEAVSCGPVGPFIACTLDDIPPGQSEVVTVVVTPTMGGAFANFVIAGGTLPCSETLAPFGSTCVNTAVGGVAAPALSIWGIAAGLLALTAISGWRLRSMRRTAKWDA
jgi:hypothetical protein